MELRSGQTACSEALPISSNTSETQRRGPWSSGRSTVLLVLFRRGDQWRSRGRFVSMSPAASSTDRIAPSAVFLWRRVNRASLLNLFANPIYAGVYAYGVRAVDKRRQKPGRPGTGRRPPRSGEAEVFLHDCLPAYISFERYRRNQAQLQSNRAAWGGAPRAGTALLGCSRLRPLRPAHARPM